MQTERKKRSGFMLCYPFEEKRLHKWGFPVLVQPKLDGIRCSFKLEEDESVTLISSTQEVILSVPHINAEIKNLFNSGYNVPYLDGELYKHGLPFEEILSITSRTVNLHDQYECMEFHVFDLIDPCYPQFIRTEKLRDFSRTVFSNPLIKIVPTGVAFDFEQVWEKYNKFLSDGYEGIIVRELNAPYIKRRSTQVMKFKPKKDDYYTVIGSVEEKDKNGRLKGRLGSLICVGSTGDIFTVGSGLTDEQRVKYWGQDLAGWLVHVQYQSTFSGTGVPRFPVFMELISPERVLTGTIHDGPPVGVVELDPNTD